MQGEREREEHKEEHKGEEETWRGRQLRKEETERREQIKESKALSELSLRYASNNTIGFYFFIIFPLVSILSLYIFSFNKSKINF